MAFVALVLAIVALPLSAIAVDLTRLTYARAVLQRAADAAAEGAAQEADIAHFQATGEVRLLPTAEAVAAIIATSTTAPLIQAGMYPSLDYVQIDEARDAVRVGMTVYLRPFLPGFWGGHAIHVDGEAQLKLRRN